MDGPRSTVKRSSERKEDEIVFLFYEITWLKKKIRTDKKVLKKEMKN